MKESRKQTCRWEKASEVLSISSEITREQSRLRTQHLYRIHTRECITRDKKINEIYLLTKPVLCATRVIDIDMPPSYLQKHDELR